MKTELQQYAAKFEADVLAFRDLSSSEFVKQVIGEKWSLTTDEAFDAITDYFNCLEVQHYRNEHYSYFEICLGCGWPNIYLNVNTRWESVEYLIAWWGESVTKDLSYLFYSIEEIYNLSAYS